MRFCFKACLMLSIFFSALAYSQTNFTNDYVVINTAGVASPETYTAAIDAANWEPFRLLDQRRKLTFDTGFAFELKSAIEIQNEGNPVNTSGYPASLPATAHAPVLKLLPGNIVGIEVNPVSPK